MNIMIFDTETVSLNKPFVYNIGYLIANTESGDILCKHDFVVEQVWSNTMLFNTAYYEYKRPLYICRMRGRTAILEKFGYITQQMIRDIKTFEVEHAFAYNSDFDENVFYFNCDWFKCDNPLELVNIHDIRGQVMKKIAFTKAFQDWCEKNSAFTESGNYSTTAETITRFLKDDVSIEEEHTALADSVLEYGILTACVTDDWTADYTVYKSVPRKVLRQLTIDNNGEKTTYNYISRTNRGDTIYLKGE